MLNRVKIQNFKSIGEPGVDLELKPLTFLVGPNGGGKSSILEAIGVAAQRNLSGQAVSFPSWKEVLHKPNSSEAFITVQFIEKSHPKAVFRNRVRVNSEGIEFDNSWASEIRPGNIKLHPFVEAWFAEKFRPNTFLISSTRGNISYQVGTSGHPTWVGIHGQELLLLLARIFGQRQNEQVARIISKWANKFEISSLNAGLWGSNTAGSDYIDPELKTALNLALSSSGSKQILTVITQLFWSSKGSLLMIEEPEISLHPKAQIDVLEMFAEAINEEDKQIIATTHGLFLIQAIGYAVQKGWLKADQVAVHHIEKKKDVGTVSKQLPVDEKGYIKGWIPSFASVERKLLEEAIKNIPEE